MTSSSRFVLDTNVLISAALIPEGKPHKVLARVLESGVLLFSSETLDELEARIYRPRFHKYLKTREVANYPVDPIRRPPEPVRARGRDHGRPRRWR